MDQSIHTRKIVQAKMWSWTPKNRQTWITSKTRGAENPRAKREQFHRMQVSLLPGPRRKLNYLNDGGSQQAPAIPMRVLQLRVQKHAHHEWSQTNQKNTVPRRAFPTMPRRPKKTWFESLASSPETFEIKHFARDFPHNSQLSRSGMSISCETS